MNTKHLFEFGSFRLDTRERLLLRNGERLKLEGKVFETLVVLIQNSGHLVRKDQFMNQVWPDAVVEENNLEKSISVLRKVLGDNGTDSKYIETVRGLGYRFAADVRELDDVSTLVRHESRTSVMVEDQEVDLAEARLGGGRNLVASPLPSRELVDVTATMPRARWLTNPRLAVVAVLLVGLGIGGYFYFFGRSKAPANLASIKSIAVLPFKSLSSDSSDEYLGLGLTDALITRLGSVNEITVRPTSTVRKYSTQQDPAAAGRDLRVESVLDGSIQKDGDRLRLTVQLVRVSDGKHLWVDKFDEKFTDILTVEDRVSERVAGALALRLTGEEKNLLAKHHTEDPDAYQLYLRGQYFWNKRTAESLNKSKEYFEQAIAKDPNSALAYGGLSDYYVLIAGTEGPKDAIPRARAAAAKALELDDTLAEPHIVLGFIKWRYDLDCSGAEREFTRAIELNPNSVLAHDRYGIYLSNMGRSDDALAQVRKAQELDPLSLLINTRAATFLYRARQYDLAIEQCRKTIELDPNFPYAHSALGWIYVMKGMYEEAIAEIKKAKASGDGNEYLAELGFAYAAAGNRGEANKVLTELKELSKQKYISPDDFALVYTSLGEKDQAFTWLDKTIQEGDMPLALKSGPAWDSLRSDPRFADLLRRAGLPE